MADIDSIRRAEFPVVAREIYFDYGMPPIVVRDVNVGRVRTLRVPGLVEPISHFSDAVIAGGTLYASGLVATDQDGNVVGVGDVVEQTRQIFRNLQRILDAAGAKPSDVAKVTIFMRDVDQRPLINPVRQEFFGAHRPASTLVEVSALVRPEYLLEIEAIAKVRD